MGTLSITDIRDLSNAGILQDYHVAAWEIPRGAFTKTEKRKVDYLIFSVSDNIACAKDMQSINVCFGAHFGDSLLMNGACLEAGMRLQISPFFLQTFNSYVKNFSQEDLDPQMLEAKQEAQSILQRQKAQAGLAVLRQPISPSTNRQTILAIPCRMHLNKCWGAVR